jgi:hypothetical protein
MLFIYIHTHPLDKCIADNEEKKLQLGGQLQGAFKEAGIKVLGNYAAPQEHTLFTIFETDDFEALNQALTPMTIWGSARMIPVIPIGE